MMMRMENESNWALAENRNCIIEKHVLCSKRQYFQVVNFYTYGTLQDRTESTHAFCVMFC
jgi:hypothetical protein